MGAVSRAGQVAEGGEGAERGGRQEEQRGGGEGDGRCHSS